MNSLTYILTNSMTTMGGGLPIAVVFTGFDKMMSLVVVLCFFYGLFRTVGGFNDWSQRPTEAKAAVISGVAIMATPILAYVIVISLYPNASGLINNPSDVAGF